MKTSSIRTQIYTLNTTNLTTSAPNPSFITPIKTTPPHQTHRLITSSTHKPTQTPVPLPQPKKTPKLINKEKPSNGYARNAVVGAATVGIALLVMGGVDDHNKALAFGPEGPLVEEFWDNVRRYALYALTVSSGAIYTIFVPILELLKNPISAVLVLTIIVGGLFIVSQVVSAMVGVTDFSYDYGY